MSKGTLNAAGTAAATVPSTALDIFTTAFDSTTALFGTEKLLQLAAAVVIGMVISNKMHTGSFTDFSSVH